MNVIVRSSKHEPGDPALLWEDEPWVFTDAKTIPELLVELKVYQTRSEARRAGRDGPIPDGFTVFKASKKVPCMCIWSPTKYTREYDGA